MSLEHREVWRPSRLYSISTEHWEVLETPIEMLSFSFWQSKDLLDVLHSHQNTETCGYFFQTFLIYHVFGCFLFFFALKLQPLTICSPQYGISSVVFRTTYCICAFRPCASDFSKPAFYRLWCYRFRHRRPSNSPFPASYGMQGPICSCELVVQSPAIPR